MMWTTKRTGFMSASAREDNRNDAGEIAVKTVTWNENTSCADIVRQAEQEDVILVRDGHAVALVTPFDDDLEWYARERDPAFLASIARARQQVTKQCTMSHQDLKRELRID